jgi:hypothetical protein
MLILDYKPHAIPLSPPLKFAIRQIPSDSLG